MHEGVCGGNFSPLVTTHRIIRAGFYWPIFFKDTYAIIRNVSLAKIFQENEEGCYAIENDFSGEPFYAMGIRCYWPHKPKIYKGHAYILTVTDYFTKWPEVVALK
jgi:hypothetical protein